MSSIILPKNQFTIVTSLIDIGREKWDNYKRPFSTYLSYLKELLALDCNFYIYIEAENYELIKEFRKNLIDKTTIKIIKLEDLYMYKYADMIKNIMNDSKYKEEQADPTCPEVTKPLYNIVVNSKVDLVYQASQEDPFGSEYFIWLDAGYGHGNYSLDINSKFDPFKLDIAENKITILCLSDISLIKRDYWLFYRQHIDIVSGGFFVVPKDLAKWYHELYYSTVDKAFDEKITDDDQYNVAMAYTSDSTLFHIIYSTDWYHALTNCITKDEKESR